MSVFNWIQTEFVDGSDFVSDASADVAAAIGRMLPAPPAIPSACEFGVFRIDAAAGHRPCVYLRFSPPPLASPVYVHVLVSDSEALGANASSIAALFRARYGEPLEVRLQELVALLTPLSVTQATLPLTNLFVSPDDLEPAERVGWAPARTLFSGRRSIPNSRHAWLLALAAAAFVGFFAGRMTSSESLAPVGAPPPSLDLARRVALLEEGQGPVGISLAGQLEYERQEHRRALEEKEQELRRLALLVEEMRKPLDPVEVSVRQTPAVAAPAPARRRHFGRPSLPTPSVAQLEPGRFAGLATVYADLLWIREGPGVEYPRISALDDGTVVELASEVRAGWVEISAPESGWVASEFLEFRDQQSASQPSPDYEVGF